MLACEVGDTTGLQLQVCRTKELTKRHRDQTRARATRDELEAELARKALSRQVREERARALQDQLDGIQMLKQPSDVDAIARTGQFVCEFGAASSPGKRIDFAFRKLLTLTPKWPRVGLAENKSTTIRQHFTKLLQPEKVVFLKYMLSDSRWPCGPGGLAHAGSGLGDVRGEVAGHMFANVALMPPTAA